MSSINDRVRESARLSGVDLPGESMDPTDALIMLGAASPLREIVKRDYEAVSMGFTIASPGLFVDALATQVVRAYMLAASVGVDLDAAIESKIEDLFKATLPPKGL